MSALRHRPAIAETVGPIRIAVALTRTPGCRTEGLLTYVHRHTYMCIPDFFKQQWPKSGIPVAFVAKVGYIYMSVLATAPGRHLISPRRPPPDHGHISAG